MTRLQRTGLQILIDDALGDIVECFVLQAHVDGTDPARTNAALRCLLQQRLRNQNPKHTNLKPQAFTIMLIWRVAGPTTTGWYGNRGLQRKQALCLVVCCTDHKGGLQNALCKTCVCVMPRACCSGFRVLHYG